MTFPSDRIKSEVLAAAGRFGCIVHSHVWPSGKFGNRCGVIAYRSQEDASVCMMRWSLLAKDGGTARRLTEKGPAPRAGMLRFCSLAVAN